MRALERRLAEQDAVVGDDPDRVATDAPEAGDEGLAVALLELVELAGVHEAGDHLAHVVRLARIGRHDAVEALRRDRRLPRLGDLPGRLRLAPGQVPNDRAADGERVLVVEGEVVGHARPGRVQLGSAQLLGRDLLAGGGLHERRAAEEDGAGALHDDGLVGHGRHVRAAGGAAPHHERHLGNAPRRQLGLVVEDAPEVLAVGKDLVLERQERAAGIHQVEAGQPVLEGDLLGAQVLLDRDRVVRPTLHRRVVGDDHAFDALDPTDAGHDPGPRRVAVVQAVGGVGTQLEEGAAGIDEAIDAVADRELAALAVAVDRSLVARGAVARQRIGSGSEVLDQGAHGVGVGARRGCIGIEGGAQHGHPPPIMAAARRAVRPASPAERSC